MSKEIDLLKECRLMLDNPINGTAGRNLQIRITELIAQPEPIENKFDRVKSNREFYQAGYAEAELKLKPEQEQEPVAWMWDEMFCEDWTTVSSVIKPSKSKYVDNVRPLYPAPPTREPLSEKEIREGNQSMLNVTREIFIKGVRFAEVMHGIGGGE